MQVCDSMLSRASNCIPWAVVNGHLAIKVVQSYLSLSLFVFFFLLLLLLRRFEMFLIRELEICLHRAYHCWASIHVAGIHPVQYAFSLFSLAHYIWILVMNIHTERREERSLISAEPEPAKHVHKGTGFNNPYHRKQNPSNKYPFGAQKKIWFSHLLLQPLLPWAETDTEQGGRPGRGMRGGKGGVWVPKAHSKHPPILLSTEVIRWMSLKGII